MAKDPGRILARLIERNPGVDGDEIKRVFVDAVMDDEELKRTIVEDVGRGLYLIIEKQNSGKSLTAGETAYLKIFSGESVSDAEHRLAMDYADSVPALWGH